MTAVFENGQRLSYEDDLCTVRFFGPVTGTKGEWIGVEWDDPTRGKHSGVHNGIKYFDCLNKSPTTASFVRPTRPRDESRSFIEAIRSKYAFEASLEENDPRLKEAETSIMISGKEVEEVGFDKIRQQLANLKALRIVLIDGLRIAVPAARVHETKLASADNIEDICPEIVELDLSRNLFEEWSEVADICRGLHKLQSLKVNGNRFRRTIEAQHKQGTALPHKLRALYFDDTLLTWPEISGIAMSFSGVQELFANGNCFTNLTPWKTLPHYTSISLERNQFKSLHDLFPLTQVSTLATLKLKGNQISRTGNETIKLNGSEQPLKFSNSLSYLDISTNAISTWSFVDDLSSIFPGLESLRISNNPLFDNLQAANGKSLLPEDGYMLTIGHLGGLERINFSHISAKERVNADTYYLSQIAQEASLVPEDQEKAVLARHPRYDALCREYGSPTIKHMTHVAIDPNVLAARLIMINFKVDENVISECGSQISDPFELELPRNLKIHSALSIIGRKLNAGPMELQFVWETGEWDVVPLETNDSPVVHAGDEDGIRIGEDGSRLVARDEILVPRTRSLGSWIDAPSATLRVEWNNENRQRIRQSRAQETE